MRRGEAGRWELSVERGEGGGERGGGNFGAGDVGVAAWGEVACHDGAGGIDEDALGLGRATIDADLKRGVAHRV